MVTNCKGGVLISKKFDVEEWKKDTQEKKEFTKFGGIMLGQNIKMSEEMMVEEIMVEGSSLLDRIEDKRYLIFGGPSSFLAVATLFLLLVQKDSNDDIYAPLLSIFMLIVPFLFISAIVAIVKLGREFYNPFFLCSFSSLPISFWEYINQSRNGCLSFGFPGSSGCPPTPPGYDTPRAIFFLFQIILLLFAYREIVEKRGWKGMYGILYALSLSTFVYFIAYFVGLW